MWDSSGDERCPGRHGSHLRTDNSHGRLIQGYRMTIEVRNISKSFGEFPALKKVSFRVEDAELVALLGPSGSGKTTLLRIIGGIEVPDDGSVLVNDQEITLAKTVERRIGFVFQHYALFRHMNVFENVAFGLKVRPLAIRPSPEAIRNKVFDLLKLVQLDRMADRFPWELSGGQRQRVALARTLAIEPKVLLLDEPFGALDAKVRQELRVWLRRLHDEIHVTSIFVTHDQEEALELADRVAILNEGEIQQIGAPDEVYHHPINSFVYHFLGRVNLFHGRLEEGRVYWAGKEAEMESKAADHSKKTTIYARPHALEINKEQKSPQSVTATVQYINQAGPVVKVALINEVKDPIYADISHERFQELQLKKGDTVFVKLKDFKVFSEDYTI